MKLIRPSAWESTDEAYRASVWEFTDGAYKAKWMTVHRWSL